MCLSSELWNYGTDSMFLERREREVPELKKIENHCLVQLRRFSSVSEVWLQVIFNFVTAGANRQRSSFSVIDRIHRVILLIAIASHAKHYYYYYYYCVRKGAGDLWLSPACSQGFNATLVVEWLIDHQRSRAGYDVTAQASQPIGRRAPSDDVNSIDRQPISVRPSVRLSALNIKCKDDM